MARRRITVKMDPGGDRVQSRAPPEIDCSSAEAAEVEREEREDPQPELAAPAMDGQGPVLGQEPAPHEKSVEQLLAAEAFERELGEQRAATMFSRYFRLTLAMVGLNMVIAGASVVTLFRHGRDPRTVVVQVPRPAPAMPVACPAVPPSVPPAVAAPAALQVPPALAAPTEPAPAPQASAVRRIHPATRPLRTATGRTHSAHARASQVAAAPSESPSSPDDEPASAPEHLRLAERW